MKNSICKISLFLFLFIVYSNVRVNGQNDYARHLEIMTQTNSLVRDKKTDDAISLLRDNKQLFQFDTLTQFWYDWLNGVILYQTDQYSEARTYISNAISFLDANLEQLSDPSIIRFLQVYYYAPVIDFRLEADKQVVIEELEHAKYIYETANATSDPVYSKITSDLNNIKNNNLNILVDASQLLVAGDYQKAIPLLHKVIEYYNTNRSNDHINLASWLKTLATAYMNIGDYNNSEQYYLASLEILESHNLRKEKEYRVILDAFSVLYTHMQNYDKANALNGKAKTLFEESVDFGDDYVRCLANGALVQNRLGYHSVAKMLIDVALRQAKQNLSDTTAFSSAISGLNQFIDKPVNSTSLDKNYYVQTRIIPYVTLLSNSAVVYSDLGYFSDAVQTVKESIRISEGYDLKSPHTYNNLGMLYFYKSKFEQATEWFVRGYSLCKTPSESDDIGMNAALGLYLSNDTTAASFCSDYSTRMRGNIKEMFAFMSGEERAIYWKHFENYLPMVNHIIYESGNDKYFGAIYDNILESKGLLLRSTNAIRDAILQSGKDSDLTDLARMGQLKQKLMTESDDAVREALNKEIEDIDKRLTRNVTTYADFAASNSINWENVRDALSDNDAAIEFYNIPIIWGRDSIQTLDGEPRYCAVLIRKDYTQPHIVPLCKESRLDNIEKEDIYESDSIYRMIWEPLEEELEGVNNIYFAADRELHKIGIEYAPMPNGDNIGNKYNIYRLSSTRLLAEKKNERRYDHAVLYGGLRYDVDKDVLIAESRSGDYHPTSTSRAFTAENSRYGVKYLPGTLKEVEDISQNFSNKPRLITDINGTEESFKSLAGSSIDIIHLATHGFFWSEDDARKRNYVTFLNPGNRAKQSDEDKALTRSGLFFSGANIGLQGKTLPDDVEDGVLTALELSNMNLGHVDMVVMSACESGLGETSGEGVFGLQRGFKLAGANTLLMSLWKVDDAATQILMTEFYRNYLSGKTKQESLRLAQQSLRDNANYSDPQYWAAFILLDGLN